MRRSTLAAASAAFVAAAGGVAGQISFEPYDSYLLPGWGDGYGVTLGDFDNDGDLDLAASCAYNPVDGRITVFSNDGAGAFGNPVNYPTGGTDPTGVVAVDLNLDGWLDLAYTLFSPGSSVKVLINSGTGTFVATQTLYSGNATGLAAGDLNGDGWPDVVSSNSQIQGTAAKVFLNAGGGSLLAGVEYTVAGGPRSVTIADFDGDKDLDLAVPALFADVVSILRNQGSGTFAAMENHSVGEGPWYAAAADLDGDGHVDLAVSSTGISFTSDVSILFGDGSGGFEPQVTYDVGYDARGIAAEDFDRDGDHDLAVVIDPQARVFVLTNLGGGVFASPAPFPCGAPGDGSYQIAAGDVNGDGRIDLAVSNLGINGSVAVLINQTPVDVPGDVTGDGTVDVADLVALITAWGPCPVSCPADLNGDGAVDVLDLVLVLTNWS